MPEPVTTSELATVKPAQQAPPQGNLPAVANTNEQYDIANWDGQVRRLATSIDLTTEAGRKLYNSCFGECDFQLTEQVNATIAIQDYLIHEYSKLDDRTGEVKDLVRLVLLSADGKSYQCSSAGIINSVRRAAFVYGRPPWKPERRATVKFKTKAGRNIFWLDFE